MLSNSRWRERWCRVRGNKLVLHKDRTDLKTHIASIPLRGCEVIPGLDSRHPLTFRLLRNGQEAAVLEVGGLGRERLGRRCPASGRVLPLPCPSVHLCFSVLAPPFLRGSRSQVPGPTAPPLLAVRQAAPRRAGPRAPRGACMSHGPLPSPGQ